MYYLSAITPAETALKLFATRSYKHQHVVSQDFTLSQSQSKISDVVVSEVIQIINANFVKNCDKQKAINHSC